MKTVILIDQDRDGLAALSGLLENEGYQVEAFVDPTLALRSMRRLQPDMAIMDTQLPRIDGLALLVQESMELNPFEEAVFVFGNRQRDKVKLLFWERNGFVVWYKRLERERFKWPDRLEDDTVSLSGQELNWLLDGYDLSAMQPHKALDFQSVG